MECYAIIKNDSESEATVPRIEKKRRKRPLKFGYSSCVIGELNIDNAFGSLLDGERSIKCGSWYSSVSTVKLEIMQILDTTEKEGASQLKKYIHISRCQEICPHSVSNLVSLRDTAIASKESLLSIGFF